LQTEVEEGIGLRLAEYSLRLHIREKLPVHSVVIFFRSRGTLPTSPFDWSWGEEDLIGSLTAIGGLRLTKEEITEALRRHPMIEDLLRESSIKDVIFDYLHPEVKAEARATGLAEGRAEGRAEGEHKMARVALEGRFGTLPDDLLTALNTADEATLEAIVAHVSTDSLDDERKRLGLS
jgi:hypothetical protein